MMDVTGTDPIAHIIDIHTDSTGVHGMSVRESALVLATIIIAKHMDLKLPAPDFPISIDESMDWLSWLGGEYMHRPIITYCYSELQTGDKSAWVNFATEIEERP